MQHFASGKRYAAGFPACSRRKTSDESVAVPNESFTLPANVGMAGSFKRTVRIMKLTAVLLTLAFLQVQAKGLGQDVTLNVKEEKLEKVLSLIEKQTGYVFFTTADLLKKARPVTLQVRNEVLSRALDLCFKGQALDYVIQGKTISVVERKINNTPTQYISASAEEVKVDVTGRVVDEKGEPVQGATVMVKGSTQATATNEKGEFRLENVEDKATLVISGINIETYEVKVRGRENLAIRVQAKVAMSEAVTVTVNTGYQTFKPNEITGSVTTISKEQLDQRVATDIISKLEGITNGLVFNKDPLTGENKIRVRGESTIFANPNPLIVVDNFPYDGNINNINPNDIESITILKDAAAASIWGVQAGNGVIVITTKRGQLSQPLRVELNTNFTINAKPDLFYSPQIAPTDYIDFETYLFNKGFYSSILNDINKPAVSSVIEILNSRKNGFISSSDSSSQINALRSRDLRSSMLDNLYQDELLQQYQINISGGGNKSNYYFSAGYDKSLSTLIGNENDRITLSSQNTFKPTQNLELKIGIFYNQSSNTNNAVANITNAYPYTQLKDALGNPVAIPQHRALFEDTISKHNFLDWKYYPLLEKDVIDNSSKVAETRILSSLRYNIIRGLSAEITYQYQKSLNTTRNYRSPLSYFIRDKYNSFAILSNGNFVGSNYNAQQLNRGLLDLTSSDLIGHYGRFKLNFNQTWRKHKIIAIVGSEIRELTTESNSSRLYGFDETTGSFVSSSSIFGAYPTYPSLTNSIIASPGDGISYSGIKNRFRSYFANAEYTYRNKYILSASARLDGSNYFGVKTNLKNVPLWSIGGKWEISKEPFFKWEKLSFLSLKTAYGFNGNMAQNLAAITTILYSTLPDSYTGLPRAVINNIPNPELRWEKIGHLNMGIDFSTKNNRISGSIEYFTKKGDDLIGDAIIDPTTGVSQIRGNFSAMKSSGVDVQLNAKILTNKLSLNTSFIFNYAREIVTRYDIPRTSDNILVNAFTTITPQEGKPLYSIFSYKWGGLDPINGDPRIILADSLNKTYNSTTIGTITINDLEYSGRYNPPLTGAIQNILNWKNLNLAFNITFKFNYYFRRSSINYSSLSNDWRRGHSDYTFRWQQPGDEKTTTVPSLVYPFSTIRDQFYTNSSILIEKGDHIRLQFINLSYTIQKGLSKLPFQSLQIYAYANNIGILWRENNKNIDPDYPYLNTPKPRSYSIGIKAQF